MDQETVSVIRKAQAGDADSFHKLVSIYDHQVMSLALKLIKNEEDAQDIYQEVFMKVFKNLKKFRFESDFSTWLYRVTTNAAFNYSRSKKKHVHVDSLSDEGEYLPERLPADAETSAGDRQATRDRIMASVDSLPQRQRTVFILKHIQKLKIKDISNMLDCSEGTVKKYLFRAVEKLRGDLEELRYA